MRTVVIEGPGSVTVETRPDPTLPGPDGAIVQVEATSICGSDLHFYDGDLPLYPVAVGHEAVGRVVEVGPDVRRYAVGDRVLISSVAGCGACDRCALGDPVTCVQGGKVFGAGELGGAQSDLLAVPAANFQLLAVPEGMSDEAALLLTDNLATGWAGAQRADFAPGATVVVIGLGAVGQCAVRAAYALGAGQVLVADPVAGRRDRAVAAGGIAIDGPTVEAVLEATGGRGAEAVIDAVALDATLDDAFGAVRAGGTVSVIGVHDLAPYPLPILGALFRSVTLRMTTAPIQRTWPSLVPLIGNGRIDTTGIFTHEFALTDAAAAYAAVAARTADCVKVLMRP
jgi:2-desacetyl-2-hydroxyethyl bacteriochlorophyllide A dehydrogenase